MNPDEIADAIKEMKRSNTVDHYAIEALVKARLKNYTGGQETDEEKVLRLIKGDFEKKNGISYEKFQEIYNEIVENNPEKLI